MNLLPAFIHRHIAHRPGLLKIIDNIGWLFLDKLLRMAVVLFVGVLVARYLGPEQFGLLNYSLSFVALFGNLVGLGLPSIVVRNLVQQPTAASETLSATLYLQLFAGIIAFFLVLFASHWLNADSEFTQLIILIVALSLPLRASNFVRYWFEAEVRSKYVVWVDNLVIVLVSVVRVLLVIYRAPLIAFVWLFLLEMVFVSLTLLLLFKVKTTFKLMGHFRIRRAGSLLRESWPLIASGLAISISMKIDQVMLGSMVNGAAVGIYAAAVRISEIWYFVPGILIASIFPSIVSLGASNSSRINQSWQQLYSLLIWLALIVAVLATFLSKWLIASIFGIAYLEASAILSIHIWAGVSVAVGSVWSRWMILEQKSKLVFYGHALGAILNVALNWILIREYEAKGAAIATLSSYSIATLIIFCFYKPSVTYNYIVRGLVNISAIKAGRQFLSTLRA